MQKHCYKIVKSQYDLQALVDFWKDKLFLSEWDVKVMFATAKELDEDQADIHYAPKGTANTALMHIVRPEEWSEGPWQQDMEEAVVHELLHLRMSFFDKFIPGVDTPENQALEDILVLVARSTVATARATPCSFYKKLKMYKPEKPTN